MGGAAIFDLLDHGKPVQRLITVTEGNALDHRRGETADEPHLTGAVCRAISEGSVLPDSYGYGRVQRAHRSNSWMQSSAMTKTLDVFVVEESHGLPGRHTDQVCDFSFDRR